MPYIFLRGRTNLTPMLPLDRAETRFLCLPDAPLPLGAAIIDNTTAVSIPFAMSVYRYARLHSAVMLKLILSLRCGANEQSRGRPPGQREKRGNKSGRWQEGRGWKVRAKGAQGVGGLLARKTHGSLAMKSSRMMAAASATNVSADVAP